jgi:hypothetical protein
MKKLKKIVGVAVASILATVVPFVIVAVTLTAPITLTSCVTNNGTNNAAQIAAAALILQNTARAGATTAITPPTGDTNNAVYFNLAAQAISTFLTGKDYSPTAFQAALTSINVPQLNNVWVQLGIGAVIDLYQVYFSQYVQGQVNGNATANAFLVAIQNGFNQALGNPVSAPQLKGKAPVPLVGPVLPRPLKK